jgi:hypothetical protein
MRALWNRVSIIWCRIFHPAPTWPIHGHYHCPACLRTYPVPWYEGNSLRRAAEASPAERQPALVVFEYQKNRG